jgi:Protein of unknown function (DUF1566)
MDHKLSQAFAFVAAALLTLGAGQVEADSKNPYYATPAWDQQLSLSNRFVVLPNWIDANFPSGGAAVLDLETGLVWERSPSTEQSSWTDASFRCNKLSVGNRMGWRLPTVQDLASLVDPTVSVGPTLPAGHPFMNVQSAIYWTATPDLLRPDDGIWAVYFNAPLIHVDAISRTAFPMNSWCVRGGQAANAQ